MATAALGNDGEFMRLQMPANNINIICSGKDKLFSMLLAALFLALITPSLWAMVGLSIENGDSVEAVLEQQTRYLWLATLLIAAVYISGSIFFSVPPLVYRTLKTVPDMRNRFKAIFIPVVFFIFVCAALIWLTLGAVSEYNREKAIAAQFSQPYDGLYILVCFAPIAAVVCGGVVSLLVNFIFSLLVKKFLPRTPSRVRMGLVIAIPALLCLAYYPYKLVTLRAELVERERTMFPSGHVTNQDRMRVLLEHDQKAQQSLPPDQPSK